MAPAKLRLIVISSVVAGCCAARPAWGQPVPTTGPPPSGAPERTLDMESVVLEDIKVEGLIQAWKFRKVCLDGQAYLLVLGTGGPTSVTAAFKDGRPEQCRAKVR